MYTDFMMFFTYGCLVRDDLIKKFKHQTYNAIYFLQISRKWHSMARPLGLHVGIVCLF